MRKLELWVLVVFAFLFFPAPVDATVMLATAPGDTLLYTSAETDTLLAARVPTSRQINTTTPLSGGGDLSADRTLSLLDDGVVFAKMQNLANHTVIGRDTSGTGDPEAVTPTQFLDWIGSTRGSVLYKGASGWAALTPGTSGHFLKSNGAGADPSYAATTGTIASVDYTTFGARVVFSTGTTLTLSIGFIGGGGQITVNGEVMESSSIGNLVTTDHLIDGAGADVGGSGMSASTTYYVYVSNSSASFGPSDMKASTTAPTLCNSGALRGYYANTSGNGANWRYAAIVRTNGSTNFVDSLTQRFVINHYNRAPRMLFSCPAYNDNSAASTYTTTSTTWTSANGGTGSKIEWLTNVDAGEAVQIGVTGYAQHSSASGESYMGIGFDSTSESTVANLAFGTNGAPLSVRLTLEPSVAGYHHANLLVATSGATMTIIADRDDFGGTTDGASTYIDAIVWG